MLSEIWKFFKRSKNGILTSDEKAITEIISNKHNTNKIEKLIYSYLKEFSVKNRQYTRKQIQYFKSQPEHICWRYLEHLDLKACEATKFNSVDKNNNEEKITSELIDIVNMPYHEYKEYLKGKENKNNYNKIAKFNDEFKNYMPKFECLKAQNERYAENHFVKELLKEAVSCISENKKKLEVFYNLKNNEKLNYNKNLENYEDRDSAAGKNNLLEDMDVDYKEILNKIEELTESESKSHLTF
jgi:hypothetical protein